MYDALSTTTSPLLPDIQDTAEMPFDGSGIDDVFMELANEFADVLELGPPEPMRSSSCFNGFKPRVEGNGATSTNARS
jgi:hypothetical protein